MHGLETIVKQNQTRFEKAIDNYRSQGCWVLAKYDGLHLVSIEAFGSAEEAGPTYAAAHNVIGERAKLLPPTPERYAAQRDQSEDRAVKPAPVTLGDYIDNARAAEGLNTGTVGHQPL